VEDPIITSTSANTSGNYTLTVTSGGCSASDVVNVSFFNSPVLTSPTNLQTFGGTQWLVKCTPPGASIGTIAINNGVNSSMYNSIDSYTINWGDGTANFTTNNDSWNNGNNITHSYVIGNYSLVLTITSTTGCSSSQSYNVFIGNQPASPPRG
jgi:hypothetical protein